MRYPDATWRPLAPVQTQPAMHAHDIVCAHTMVGNLVSTDAMFHENGWGGTESHFGIGGRWGADVAKGYDGRVFEWQDCRFTADANYQGNPRVISIETADNAPNLVENIQAWDSAQLTAIVKLVAWLCSHAAHASCPTSWTCRQGVAWAGTTVAIPPVLVADSKPGRRGIAYHRQGCEHSDGIGSHPGWLVAGGERWSTSLGKGCPGPTRIAQLQQTVIPRVQDLMRGNADMPLTNADVDLIWGHSNTIVGQSPGGALKTAMDRVDADNLRAQVREGIEVALDDPFHPLTARFVALETTLDAILAAVTAPPAPPAG
jgi:hypothetical protein